MTSVRIFFAAFCLLWFSIVVPEAPASRTNTLLPAVKVPLAGKNVRLMGFPPASLLPRPAVRVLSSEGPFDMELLPQFAPNTVTNFLNYVEAGFYRGLLVHRSVTNFVIQTGGVGLGGSASLGASHCGAGCCCCCAARGCQPPGTNSDAPAEKPPRLACGLVHRGTAGNTGRRVE
jgi:hypothetical protein